MSLFFAGCDLSNDLIPETEINDNLKSAEMKIVPIKGEVQSHITVYSENIPVEGLLSGKVSHLGKLIAENSVFYTTDMSLDESTMILHWEMMGSVCAANGDMLNYLLAGDFEMLNNQLIAHADFNGGSGRFENAEGFLEITGYADDPINITTMYMTCKGLISNVGRSK